MSEPYHHDHHRHAFRVATIRPRSVTPGQIAAGLAGALLVAAAAVAVVLLLVTTTARAEPLSADAVLSELEARAERLQDITFVLEGELRDEAGQRFAVEIEVMAIPSPQAASLYIIQPDALADNIVVVTETEIRNYTFLTNQVAVYDVDDPDAFGGLLPGDEMVVIDLDLGSVFAGWEVRIEQVEAGATADVYTLRFDNRDPDAAIKHVTAVIDAGDWLPLRLTFYSSETEAFADLSFTNVEVDGGLAPADVTWLPDDAEVLDRRR